MSGEPPAGAPRITEIQVKLQDSKALKAFVSVTLADCFVVRGLKIIQGMQRRFVAMPGRKRRDDTYQDIAHPITREFRDYLEGVVLRAYDREVERATGAVRMYRESAATPGAAAVSVVA